MFITATITSIWSLISPLFAQYKLEGTNGLFGLFNFIVDSFVYKRQFILILITMNLLSQSYSSLGLPYLIGAIIAVIVAIFALNIYNVKKTSNDTILIKATSLKVVKGKVMEGKELTNADISRFEKTGGDDNIFTQEQSGGKKRKHKKYNIQFV